VDETGIANPGWLAQGALGLQCLPLGTVRVKRSAAGPFGCGLQTVSPEPAKGYGG